MKKMLSMFLMVCVVLTSATFAFAVDSSEHTPPFKVIHGKYFYDPVVATQANTELRSVSDSSCDTESSTAPFRVIHGTFSYDPPGDQASDIVTRAITKPTTYAPASFYNVKHHWTATNYTWSSYMFTQRLGYRFDCRAKQNFAVEFYQSNGVYEGTTYASYNDIIKGYWVEIDREYNSIPYYVKIVNKSSSPIRNNAMYYVSDLSHSLPANSNW